MTKPEYNGDDLDDGLEYQVDVSDDNETFNSVPLEDEDEIAPEPTSDDDLNAANERSSSENPSRKKRKATESKFKDKKRLKMEIDLEQKKNIAKETSTEVIADYINKTVTQKNKKLSSLELTDLFISKDSVRSTSEIEGERNLEGLAKYLNSRFKNMLPGKKNKEQEKKYIAILSMSAIRACDVHRGTKDLLGSSLKLINKNKLNVDISLLKKSNSRVLCCTPARLKKVYDHEDKVLDKSTIKIILLDQSYLDQKGQNIWDIPDTINVLKDLTSSGAKIYLY